MTKIETYIMKCPKIGILPSALGWWKWPIFERRTYTLSWSKCFKNLQFVTLYLEEIMNKLLWSLWHICNFVLDSLEFIVKRVLRKGYGVKGFKVGSKGNHLFPKIWFTKVKRIPNNSLTKKNNNLMATCVSSPLILYFNPYDNKCMAVTTRAWDLITSG